MREKFVCRFCEARSETLVERKGGSRIAGRRSFAISGSSPHYAPDRPFRPESILLDLTLDPYRKALSGKTIQKFRVVAPDQKELVLDQIGLDIQKVSVDGKESPFLTEGNHLKITLLNPPKPDQTLEVTLDYRAPHPKRGIYFTGPDADYPKKPHQVWTQGQDEDSRHWFPALDYPNQKVISEVIATVPSGFTAISNGALLSKTEVKIDSGVGTRYHYKLGIPHVTYLISLVVAELVEIKVDGPRGLPVQYFVHSLREADGKRSFENTPKMIEVFERKTGIPFPYEKYSQVTVQDFIFGGMENTSATTQTELTLHDERAHLDFSSDPLVSHELAHQWFGNLITCRDWSHGWLNEGFATFMERIWVEANSGPNGGWEEAKYYSYQDLQEHFSEDESKYRRPIVSNHYIEPIDLFDTHLYQKGGLVLNLMRHVLGEDQFWKSIRLYASRHKGQNVETLDLIRAIEDATGRNLRRFFDEWIFNAGYPEIEASYQWHEDKKLTEWVIEQKQTRGAPSLTENGATTLLFHLPVTLEITLEGGEKIRHRIEIGELRERIFLPSKSRPVMVRFDPDHWIPKKLKFPRPKELLLYQLKNDSDGMGRIEAIQELLKIADAEIIQALGETVINDPFWAVQAEAAKALGEIRTPAALQALLNAVQVQHPKARRAVVRALGLFKDKTAVSALKTFAEKDPSYFVEADATLAWAQASLRPSHPANEHELDSVEAFLSQQLEKSSYREVIRVAALQALAELPGINRGERPQALETLIQWTQRGKDTEVRTGAIRALGAVLAHAIPSVASRILDVFSALADEDSFRLRTQLISVLESSGNPTSISILRRIGQHDSDGRIRRGSRDAIETVMASEGVPESVSQLKASISRLEEEQKKLRAKVEET